MLTCLPTIWMLLLDLLLLVTRVTWPPRWFLGLLLLLTGAWMEKPQKLLWNQFMARKRVMLKKKLSHLQKLLLIHLDTSGEPQWNSSSEDLVWNSSIHRI